LAPFRAALVDASNIFKRQLELVGWAPTWTEPARETSPSGLAGVGILLSVLGLELQMANAIYECSVPVFVRHLKILDGLLEMAETHAKDRKIDSAALLLARLFPDMFTLAGQVRSTCDTAKRSTARLVGLEAPQSQDTDKTFADLHERIRDAVSYLEGFPAERFEGAEERKIEFPYGGSTVSITAQQYLSRFSLPNFYFHVTTAYDIFRHNGVVVGKSDFLGSLAD
jgi:uncharacterized protein